MLIHAPPLLDPELPEDVPRRPKGSVAVVERHEHAIIGEPYNVRPTVSREVREETGVLIHAPPLLDSELHDNELRRLKGSGTIALRDPYALIAEPHEVDSGRDAKGRDDAQVCGRPVLIGLAHGELPGCAGNAPQRVAPKNCCRLWPIRVTLLNYGNPWLDTLSTSSTLRSPHRHLWPVSCGC